MYNLEIEKRFSYDKTKDFWNIFNRILSSSHYKSYEYAITIRDFAIFQLSYSFGVKISELFCLSILDFDFNPDGTEGYSVVRINNSRIVYSLFSKSNEVLNNYFTYYKVNLKLDLLKYAFVTTRGEQLNISYLNKRLNCYNAQLPKSSQIGHLYVFRQLYINDILRMKVLPQSFINNQIGNSTMGNLLYSNK